MGFYSKCDILQFDKGGEGGKMGNVNKNRQFQQNQKWVLIFNLEKNPYMEP